jgi:hypothetical protein
MTGVVHDLHQRERDDGLVGHLRTRLGDTVVDDDGNELHGLAWWYPQVKAWPSVRSVGSSGGGRGGGSAPPLNLEAVDFLGNRYWIGETDQDKASLAEQLDDENYRAGLEPTVLGLELAVRRALGHLRPPRQRRTSNILAPAPAVVAALGYLWQFAPEIVADEFLHELVREEVTRLVARARSMMHGSLWTAGRGPCPECHGIDTVVNDDDRAVCLNPFCRDSDGGRRCWGKAADGQWVRIPEPDIRSRGRLDDDTLRKLTGT